MREFLHSACCVSPWGTWYRLQREELGRKLWQIQDGKGVEVMGKITLEQKKKAVDIALAGNDPVPYLRECGSEKPAVTWFNIKRGLEKADPEKYGMLDEIADKPVTKEEPKIDMTINSEEIAEKPREIKMDDLVFRAKSEPEITDPGIVFGESLRVTAICDPDLGEFYHDRKFKCMDWRLEDGDEVSLSVGGWHRLIEKLPEILKILGI